MLKEISIKSKLLNNLCSEIKEEVEANNTLIKSIHNLKKELISKQSYLLKLNESKAQQIQLKQDHSNTSVLIEDDFKTEKNLIKKNGFELIGDMSVIKLEPAEKTSLIFDNLIVTKNTSNGKGIITYTFAKRSEVSCLDVLFKDKNGVMITPTSVRYIYDDIEGELLEEFERFFDRSTSDESNKYYFYTKKIDKLVFEFDMLVENIDLNLSIVTAYLESFNEENELILKYKNSSIFEKLKITKNFYDKLNSLTCYISSDNNSYKEINFENNKAIITNPQNSFFYIKIIQKTIIKNTSKENQKIISTSKQVTEINVADLKNNYIELLEQSRYIDSDTLKIVLPFSVKKAIKDINENYVKIDNFKNYLDSNYIEIVDNMEKYHINELKDLDSIEALKDYNKPVLYFEKNTNILYLATFFINHNLNFRVEFDEIEIQEILNNKNYTPFLFDLKAEE